MSQSPPPVPGPDALAIGAAATDAAGVKPAAAAPGEIVAPAAETPAQAELARQEEARQRRGRRAARRRREEEDEDDEDDDEEDEDDEDDVPHVLNFAETRNALLIMGRFLKPFLIPQKKGLGLILIAILIETAYNTAFPLALKFLIDDALNSEEPTILITILVVMFVMGTISSIVMVWFEWLNAKYGSAIIADIRAKLFDHAQDLPVQYYQAEKTGNILQRFSSDISELEETVNHGTQWGVLPTFELVAGLILMFFLNWQMALLACLLMPIAIIGPRYLAPKAVDASYSVKKAEGQALSVVQEVITSMPIIKAFALRRQSVGWFRTQNHNVQTSMRRTLWLNGLVERSVTISVLALHLFVLALGAYLVWTEQMTLGSFVAFETLFWELSYNVGHITQFIPVLIESAGAARHVNDFLHVPIRSKDREDARELPPLQREIVFEDVVFSYDGKQNHLRGLNLVIPFGQRIAIVGRSGAGKSTVINLLLKLYDVKRGRILLDGHDISELKRDSVREQMAVVFQDNLLFGMSVRENIRLGKLDATDEEVEAAAKAADIHDFIMSLPEGYDTLVGERGSTVSGGQKQRLAIARALIRNPTLLLLDEATSALDQTTERSIMRTIDRVAVGRSVICVTHRLTSVVDMDMIYVLERGKLAEAGTHKELMLRKKTYYRLWRDQIHREREEEEE